MSAAQTLQEQTHERVCHLEEEVFDLNHAVLELTRMVLGLGAALFNDEWDVEGGRWVDSDGRGYPEPSQDEGRILYQWDERRRDMDDMLDLHRRGGSDD